MIDLQPAPREVSLEERVEALERRLADIADGLRATIEANLIVLDDVIGGLKDDIRHINWRLDQMGVED